MNGLQVKVLLIEDNLGDARLLQEMLLEVNVLFDIKHADRLSTGLEQLAQGGIDIVLLDLSLPDSHGIDTFSKVHAQAPNVPIILLTGLSDESLATTLVREGAQDYLVKGQIDGNVLVRAIHYGIERQQMLTKLEETRQAQLTLRDQFLSHVSHELRSPLTPIHQFLTILLDGLAGELTSEQREYIEIILKNTNHLRVMIGDLLEVTRAGAGTLAIEPKRVSLPELITENVITHKLAAAERNITLSAEIPQEVPSVYADPTRVREVLSNLLDNALKFTPEQGEIKANARVYKENPKFLCVSVTDNGCGISAHGVKMIFERMFQEKIADEAQRASLKGLGLGLYICKELVTRQGGEIWVKSQIGQGSTFFFTLPIAVEQA